MASSIWSWMVRRSGRAPIFGSYPKSTNFSLTLSVTSRWMLLLERRLLTSASMSSTIWRRLSLLRALNSMMPSKRFINSGLKKLPSSPRTELVRPSRAAPKPTLASALPVPAFEVMIMMASLKLTVRPCPSVKRPSSKTWRNMCMTSGWAFSTSSRRMRE